MPAIPFGILIGPIFDFILKSSF